VPIAQRRPPPKPLRHYAARYKDPHEAMAQAYRSGGYSLKAIADHFGVHYSTVSRALGRTQ
jgi:transposase